MMNSNCKKPFGFHDFHKKFSALRVNSPVIFCLFTGTPDDQVWPGVTQMPDYKSTFPKWLPAKDLGTFIPGMDAMGVDLFQVC